MTPLTWVLVAVAVVVAAGYFMGKPGFWRLVARRPGDAMAWFRSEPGWEVVEGGKPRPSSETHAGPFKVPVNSLLFPGQRVVYEVWGRREGLEQSQQRFTEGLEGQRTPSRRDLQSYWKRMASKDPASEMLAGDIKKMMEDSKVRIAAENEYLNFIVEHPLLAPILSSHEADGDDLKACLNSLVKAGCGQWRDDCYVAGAALAYPDTLEVCLHTLRGEEPDWHSAAAIIFPYFEII